MSTTDVSSAPSGSSSVSATSDTCSRNSFTSSNSRADADELGEVLEPAFGFDRVLGLEVGDVARAIEDGFEHRRRTVGHHLGEIVEQVEELGDAFDRSTADAGRLGSAQRFDERAAVGGRPRVEPADRGVTDAALRAR